MRGLLFAVLLLVSGMISEYMNFETVREACVFFDAGNEYFFPGNVRLSADITADDVAAYESWLSPTLRKTEQTHIDVYRVTTLQNGSIYKMAVAPIEILDRYLTDARLILYFYVTDEEIYRIWSYVYDGGEAITFYNDDDLLTKSLDTEEKIFNNSYMVCRPDHVPDLKEHHEQGMHNIIRLEGNLVMSKMWNVTPNGESYFYENLTWELGKGLRYYESGFRAERDVVLLDNIFVIDK